MIVVTGGAGFIGSNIVKNLNQQGIEDIIVVDDLTDGSKYINLADLNIRDYFDKDHFHDLVMSEYLPFSSPIEAIIHQGACSDTTEWDGKYMLENNYEYSKLLLHYCLEKRIPFLYASSAAVYGGSDTFIESSHYEKPLNVYGYSKLLFDNYVRRILPSAKSQIAGFRYFNVYGPREQHKGKMASVAYHFNQQIQETGVCKLFQGIDGYQNGEQLRDFVYIDDVVDVNLWFLNNTDKSGIFNLGTGQAQSFNDVANAVIQWHQKGKIEYIPFPEHLLNHYQSYTQADLSSLRQAGYDKPFKSVETGVADYLDKLHSS